MSFQALTARRKRFGQLGTLLLLLVLASLVDGMIAGGRKDPNLSDVLPGQSLKLSDQMPRGAAGLDALQLRSSSPDISAQFMETYAGFWLGGTLWRAEVSIAPGAQPGENTVAVLHQNGTETGQVFRLAVHPDARAQQNASLSLVTREFGISPYLLAVCLLPLVLLPMGASFLLSRRIAAALLSQRMTEIYRAMATPEGQRISFGLGARHGVTAESSIQVLDEQGETVLGQAKPIEILKEDTIAVLLDGVQVRPGTLAKLLPSPN